MNFLDRIIQLFLWYRFSFKRDLIKLAVGLMLDSMKSISIFCLRYSLLLLLVLLSHQTFSQEKKLVIQMDPLIRELIQFKIAQDKILFADYHYTIQIGFGSLQEMNDLKEKFETNFPHVVNRIIFETPHYKLHVGKSRNQVRLHQLLGEIKAYYPNAFVIENT